jgi:hypothetical protein
MSKHSLYKTRKKIIEDDSTTIKWGKYNIKFPTFGNKGAEELHDFLSRLEGVAQFPQIKKESVAKIMQEVCGRSSKYDILMISHRVSDLPPDDLMVLTDQQSLQQALKQPFQVPLLHRATIKSPSLGTHTGFSLQQFLDHLSEKKEASISVYNYLIANPEERTYQTTVDALLSHFQSNNDTPLNFLDNY